MNWWRRFLIWLGILSEPAPVPSREWQLRGSHNGQDVVITASDRFGGAIYSIKLGGYELLDSSDNGRLLQTAWQMNSHGEDENPTEGGGAGYASTTRILSAAVTDNVLTTSCNPAYWHPFNGQVTSPHKLDKTVTLGYQGRSNVIRHQITITLAYQCSNMPVEGLTGYMPRQFQRWALVSKTSVTEVPTPPHTGLQMQATPNNEAPVVALPDGSKAIGAVSPAPGYGHGYGEAEGWPKWDAGWFHVDRANGSYSYEVFTVFGTLAEATATIQELLPA